MGRNSELIRQWTLLQQLAVSRTNTIPKLATDLNVTTRVSDDYALRGWLLGFGRFVRVIAPDHLIAWIEEELEQARQQYASGAGIRVTDSDSQPALPFLFNRLVTA